ncbi:MAG: phosphoribosylanthranilate isomerase [Planctomycetota bacterium]|jgi:phosphoribosylanthranilate isomerase
MSEAFVIPRVKVCGLTRTADALHALAVGADALGFVFHPSSPRCATVEEVAAITTSLPGDVLTVAVLVEATPKSAKELLESTGLRAVQLCGDQSAQDWVDFPVPILRRIGVGSGATVEIENWEGIASVFLLDHPRSTGGSGQQVDRQLAGLLCQNAACMLAGGLDGTQVARAIREVLPAGVDASSRLESSPGIKDLEAVRDFVTIARNTFKQLDS